MGRQLQPPFNHAASARLPANSEMLRLRYRMPVGLMIYPAYGRDGRSARAEARPPLFCRAIRQNDANGRALAEGAFGFYPATMELRYMFDDG